MSVAEQVIANKVKLGKAEVRALLRTVTRVVAARGQAIVEFDLAAKKKPAEAEVLAAIIGPTGNLRAPTFRAGNTLVVGFRAEMYGRVLGVT